MDDATTTHRHPMYLMGVATNVHQHQFGIDILNLTNTLFVPFVPMALEGFQCVFWVDALALLQLGPNPAITFHWTDESTGNTGTISTTILLESAISCTEPGTLAFLKKPISAVDALKYKGPRYIPMSVPLAGVTVTLPTRINLRAEWNNELCEVGSLLVSVFAPLPMSLEERKALASSPNAGSVVTAAIGCAHCGATLCAYAALDPSSPTHNLPPDAIEVSILPDSWTCKCGKTTAPLVHMKRGLFHLFRASPGNPNQAINLTPLYRKGQVTALYRNYSTLIDSNPSEETVQAFIDKHPLIWAFLSPKRIIPKPRLLTHHTADFGILTHHNVLYFVELEKPSTTLLTKKGHPHAEVNAAIRQVLDWTSVIADKRVALLDELAIESKNVSDIRYIVVAGLAKNASAKGLEKLHLGLPPKTQFLCFDHLGAFLLVIQANLDDL